MNSFILPTKIKAATKFYIVTAFYVKPVGHIPETF